MTRRPAKERQCSNFFRMASLEATLSPASWALLGLGLYLSLAVILAPTIPEFSILILLAAFNFILLSFGEKWLPKVLPQYSPRQVVLFTRQKGDKASSNSPYRIDALPFEKKLAWMESLIRYPARRANYCLGMSGIRLIPELLLIVCVWHHPQGAVCQRLAIVIAVYLTVSASLFGMVFVENHAFVSEVFADMHQRSDWSDVFRKIQIPFVQKDFDRYESAALIAVCVLVLICQGLMITTLADNRGVLALKVITVGVSGLALYCWLWSLCRGSFLRGLERIFVELERFDPEKTTKTLPLHSSPFLARFERTFNKLAERLRAYHRELSHRVYLKTDESRYQALGEMAALVVHDLSTPLHIVRFCLDQLQREGRLDQDKYFQQLQRSSQRACELIDSLRAYIRNPRGKEVIVEYADAQKHVMRLLEVQFYSRGLSSVEFDLDPLLSTLQLRMAKADLIHVLINLLANSIENLLANATSHPKISVKLEENRGKHVLLSFRDNGTGLGAEEFDRLTAWNPEPESGDRGDLGGLGLRLVRRLVERYHGSLSVVDLPVGEAGTLFQLWIPSVPDSDCERIEK